MLGPQRRASCTGETGEVNNSEGGKALRCNERTTREEGKRTAFVLLDVLARSKRTTFAPREITAQFQTPATNFACIVEQRKFVWILTLEDVFAIGIISKPCHCLVRSRFVRTKIEFITTIPIQDFPPYRTSCILPHNRATFGPFTSKILVV